MGFAIAMTRGWCGSDVMSDLMVMSYNDVDDDMEGDVASDMEGNIEVDEAYNRWCGIWRGEWHGGWYHGEGGGGFPLDSLFGYVLFYPM